ncbi:MAG: T9SS type A sorting domain-containing protein, partial [Pyrinomonadaceae bacterium]|nr:T9SS type A sorting domain-containing protein [Sphingobacteriaceae bacterium]
TNHPSGYKYVAHFSYSNVGSSSVYIPVGADNKITTPGSYSGTQPQLFLPGVHHFDIYFDGSNLNWEVKSYEVNQKNSVVSNASSASSGCKTILASSSENNLLMLSGDDIANLSSEKLSAVGQSINSKITLYPNPATDFVKISIPLSSISVKDISLFDINGRLQQLNYSEKMGENEFSMNVSNLLPGIYLVKIKVADTYQIFRIIKL